MQQHVQTLSTTCSRHTSVLCDLIFSTPFPPFNRRPRPGPFWRQDAATHIVRRQHCLLRHDSRSHQLDNVVHQQVRYVGLSQKHILFLYQELLLLASLCIVSWHAWHGMPVVLQQSVLAAHAALWRQLFMTQHLWGSFVPLGRPTDCELAPLSLSFTQADHGAAACGAGSTQHRDHQHARTTQGGTPWLCGHVRRPWHVIRAHAWRCEGVKVWRCDKLCEGWAVRRPWHTIRAHACRCGQGVAVWRCGSVAGCGKWWVVRWRRHVMRAGGAFRFWESERVARYGKGG